MLLLPDSELGQAVSCLREGGIVVHATETCYGIACDLTNPAAVERLFLTKKRPFTQPVSALFSSIDEAEQYLEFSNLAHRLAEKHLPGPLTIVLPVRKGPRALCTVPNLQSLIPNPSIGLRLSSNPLAQALVRGIGRPVATTSANLHGLPSPYSAAAIVSQFSDVDPRPDLLLDSGVLPFAPPSTVLQIIDDQVTVLRQGELTL